MVCWQAVGEHLLYLTLVLSVLKTDVNHFSQYEDYPEVQETIYGENLVPLTADYHLDRLRTRKEIDDQFLQHEIMQNEVHRLARSMSNVGTCRQEICMVYLLSTDESLPPSYTQPVSSNAQEQPLDLEGDIEYYDSGGDYSSFDGIHSRRHDSLSDMAIVPAQYWRENSLEQDLSELDIDSDIGWFEPAEPKPQEVTYLEPSHGSPDSAFIAPVAGYQASGWDSDEYSTHTNYTGDLWGPDQYLYQPDHSSKPSLNYMNNTNYTNSLPSTSFAIPTPTLNDLEGMELDYDLLDQPVMGDLQHLEIHDDLLEEADMEGVLQEEYLRHSISDDSAVSFDDSLSAGSFSETESFSSFEGSGNDVPDFSVLCKREPSASPYEQLLDDLRNCGSFSSNVSHNHTYSAPYGGVPHVRKMDIKVEKEPTRGDAHDEILLHKMEVPFDLETIICVPVDQFNRLLKKNRLSTKQIELVKDIRRRGKNKVAAQNCRIKKIGQASGLEQEIEDLRKQRETLTATNTHLKQKSDILNRKIDRETHELLKQMKNKDGSMFDPSKFTIEVDEHGNIHVTPIDSKSETGKSKKSQKRHKY